MARVELVDDPGDWPGAFRALALDLRAALGGADPVVEHIGSTAVPGLCAKAVVDVLAGVAALEAVGPRLPDLEALGFRYRPELEAQIPMRRYFVRDADGHRPRAHVHVVVLGGPLWRDHLAFRDALRGDAALAARYAALKRDLAGRLDKAAYTEAKGPFVREVLAAAGRRSVHDGA